MKITIDVTPRQLEWLLHMTRVSINTMGSKIPPRAAEHRAAIIAEQRKLHHQLADIQLSLVPLGAQLVR